MIHKPVVLITGASGFIGSYLVTYLLNLDYQIIALTRHRHRQKQQPSLEWIEDLSEIKTNKIDYVINLAGESIGQGRWTEKRKEELKQSRIKTTKNLYEYLKRNNIFPKTIISGSAVGFYGIDQMEKWSDVCSENASPQSIFMSELCQQWEAVTAQYPEQKTKIIRLGVVFGRKGGILPQMLLPIRLNLIGKMGSGKQPCVWIHIQDVLRSIVFLMTTETSQSIFNVVAPEKVCQANFVSTSANILKRKPFITLPSFIMKLMLGEQSQLILNGQYVKPKALQDAGFEFKYPTLKQALKDLLEN